MPESFVWISYDLGVRGDYESLYVWLDQHGAVECGDSMGYLRRYQYTDNLAKDLREDLERSIRTDRRTRIYAIWKAGNKASGRFIIGGRRAAPWAGYSSSDSDSIDEAS